MAKYKKAYITKQATAAELKRLYRQSGGLLKPEDVVQAARNPKSPLHDYFEWNDSAAAERWRIEQARRLLRVTVEFIHVDGATVPMRVFCSLSADQGDEGGYRATVDVIKDEGMRKLLLADARRDMDIFTERYSQLKELAGVIQAMRKVLTQ